MVIGIIPDCFFWQREPSTKTIIFIYFEFFSLWNFWTAVVISCKSSTLLSSCYFESVVLTLLRFQSSRCTVCKGRLFSSCCEGDVVCYTAQLPSLRLLPFNTLSSVVPFLSVTSNLATLLVACNNNNTYNNSISSSSSNNNNSNNNNNSSSSNNNNNNNNNNMFACVLLHTYFLLLNLHNKKRNTKTQNTTTATTAY